MESPMNNEKNFFADAFAQGNPGWSVAAGKDLKPGAMSEFSAYLYIVDTKTGWIGAAATSEPGFRAINKSLPEIALKANLSLDDIASVAANWIVEAGRVSAESDAKEALQAINATAITMANTKTYETVFKGTGSARGHWIYLVYSLNDKTTSGRPVYLSEPASGLMDTAVLRNFVDMVIRGDLSAPKSFVGGQILAGGGMKIHESFRSGDDAKPSSDAPKG
jgi:hypothetical protein